MEITLHRDDGVYKATQPRDGMPCVEVPGQTCPKCGRPLNAAGIDGAQVESHDTYASRAVSICCKEPVGILRVKVSTIFGIEEDERVMNGRCRVY